MIKNFSTYFLYVLISIVLANNVIAQSNSQKPNIVVIFADDLGWADLTCYGSTFYETPNLDKLAANGLKFMQSYTTSPVCSPTRASLMTGKYPVKTGVTDWITGRQADGKAKPFEKLISPPTAYELALEETTIAELALQNGYKTFFAGKWHLGEEEKFWPQYQGFQTNIGGWSKGGPTGRINDSTGGYFSPYSNPTLKDGPKGEYITDRLANECINFLNNNGKEPFFLMYSLYAVHNPLQAPKALINKYEAKQKKLGITANERFVKDEPWMKFEKDWKRRLVQDNPVYAAMIENMDWNIGRIINKIKELGLEENTFIVFTSDNGGLSTAEGSPTTNGILKAGKGWMYEGGIRVPLIMYWKGKIATAVNEDLPVTTADIFTTLAKLVINNKHTISKEVDGIDIFSLIKNAAKSVNRTLYWHYPHYSNQGGKPSSAIREGRFKLIYNYEDASTELYDIVNDIQEKNNIAPQNPKIVKQLKAKLDKWLKQNRATYPVSNPNYVSTLQPE